VTSLRSPFPLPLNCSGIVLTSNRTDPFKLVFNLKDSVFWDMTTASFIVKKNSVALSPQANYTVNTMKNHDMLCYVMLCYVMLTLFLTRNTGRRHIPEDSIFRSLAPVKTSRCFFETTVFRRTTLCRHIPEGSILHCYSCEIKNQILKVTSFSLPDVPFALLY
jgi:hypothetical protein